VSAHHHLSLSSFCLFIVTDLGVRVDLCGEEVTPNYPHEEVAHAGVNHFPEGVFQKCRTIIVQEKQAEIDRLKRVKRLKNQNPALTGSPSRRPNAQVVPVANEWEELPMSDPGTPIGSPLTQSTRSTRPPPGRNNAEAAWLSNDSQRGSSRGGTSAVVYDQFDQEWEMAIALARSSATPARGESPVTIEVVTPFGSPSPSKRSRTLQGARGSNISIPLSPVPGSPQLNPLQSDLVGSSQRMNESTRSNRAPSLTTGSPQQMRLQFPRFQSNG